MVDLVAMLKKFSPLLKNTCGETFFHPPVLKAQHYLSLKHNRLLATHEEQRTTSQSASLFLPLLTFHKFVLEDELVNGSPEMSKEPAHSPLLGLLEDELVNGSPEIRAKVVLHASLNSRVNGVDDERDHSQTQRSGQRRLEGRAQIRGLQSRRGQLAGQVDEDGWNEHRGLQTKPNQNGE